MVGEGDIYLSGCFSVLVVGVVGGWVSGGNGVFELSG